MRSCLLSVLIFSFLFACSHKEKLSKDPSSYLDQTQKHIKNGNYIKARESLKKLKKNFFYGPWSSEALLLRADVNFHQAKYSSAIHHYQSYLKTYPFKKKDYVLFQIGLSYKNQLPRRAVHDLRLAEPAIKAFRQILKLSSASSYKAKALEAIKQLERQQTEKELKAILFYKKLGWNRAGLLRLKDFIETHSKSPLMPKALLAGIRMAERGQTNPKVFKQMLREKYSNSPEFKASKERESFFSNWRAWLL